MTALYDSIGLNYADLRRPDPRIAAQIHAKLGSAQMVLNVGAGAGNYEPTDRQITAVEPSAEMIAQRPASDAKVIQGTAEALPFEDDSFDAALAVLTIHHWTDQAKGAAEVRRVTKGPITLLTYDPAFRDNWLFAYFPALTALDDAQMPPIDSYADLFGPVEIETVPIPHDCTDGFLAAYWRRPATYLVPKARAAISSFHKIGDFSDGLARLERDLKSGAWQDQFGELMNLHSADMGYRLVTTR